MLKEKVLFVFFFVLMVCSVLKLRALQKSALLNALDSSERLQCRAPLDGAGVGNERRISTAFPLAYRLYSRLCTERLCRESMPSVGAERLSLFAKDLCRRSSGVHVHTR